MFKIAAFVFISVLSTANSFAQDKPSPRVAHMMAYDESRKVFVTFSGMSPQLLADTWEFDGKSWRKFDVAGPSGRTWHGMAYDPNLKDIVLFGGMVENRTKAGDPRDYFGDTWTWDGKAWKQMSPTTSPQPRFFHLMIYDEALESVVLLAGGQGRESFNDAWQWTGSDWKKLDVPPAPAPNAEAFLYDSLERAWLIFGGSTGSREMSNKVYRLQDGNWVESQ